jgi:hypothetical protein
LINLIYIKCLEISRKIAELLYKQTIFSRLKLMALENLSIGPQANDRPSLRIVPWYEGPRIGLDRLAMTLVFIPLAKANKFMAEVRAEVPPEDMTKAWDHMAKDAVVALLAEVVPVVAPIARAVEIYKARP